MNKKIKFTHSFISLGHIKKELERDVINFGKSQLVRLKKIKVRIPVALYKI